MSAQPQPPATHATVTARDGTPIAYTRRGSGPPLILVDGALCTRASGPNEPLAKLLAQQFTVYTYDRRGRGDSGDTQPYAVEREVEDIAALIDAAGGSANLYGISSGAALALEAAQRALPIRALALYEAPFVVDATRRPVPQDYLHRLRELLAAGRRGAAVKHFMRNAVGLPGIFVAIMPLMPVWSKLKRVAHTLVYDALILGDAVYGNPLPPGRWSRAQVRTLVAVGGKSPPWMRNGMRALADVLPNAHHRTLPGQTHIVQPAALTPLLVEFFAGGENGASKPGNGRASDQAAAASTGAGSR